MIDLLNIHSVNPLYLVFDKTDEYIEESNGNKYLIFASTMKAKTYWQNTQNFGIKLKVCLKQ